MGSELMKDYLLAKEIGANDANEAFVRAVEYARNEFVRNARVVPNNIPDSEELAEILRGKLREMPPKNSAVAYDQLMTALTEYIKFQSQKDSQKKAAS
jgi:hypothetical protein